MNAESPLRARRRSDDEVSMSQDGMARPSRGSVIAAVAAVVVMAVMLAMLYGVYIHEIQRAQTQARADTSTAAKRISRTVPTTPAELARWHRNDEASVKAAEKPTPDLP